MRIAILLIPLFLVPALSSAQWWMVKFEVTGTAKSVNIAYEMGSDIHQKIGKTLPWSDVTFGWKGVPLAINARNTSDEGDITVSIKGYPCSKKESEAYIAEMDRITARRDSLNKLESVPDPEEYFAAMRKVIADDSLRVLKYDRKMKLLSFGECEGASCVAQTATILVKK